MYAFSTSAVSLRTSTPAARSSSSSPVAIAIASSLVLLASGPAAAAAARSIDVVSYPAKLLPPLVQSSSSTYHLARILFLRALAAVYVSAFSVAKNQNRGLIGDAGITPARDVLDRSEGRGAARSAARGRARLEGGGDEGLRRGRRGCGRLLAMRCWHGFLESAPVSACRDKFWFRTDAMGRPLISLLWLARDRSRLNPWLDGLADVGLVLSLTVLVTGCANVPIMLGLWLVQRSLMSVGGAFYGYGWEPQLAELTFHAMFLVPILSMDPFLGPGGGGGAATGAYPVPMLVILAIRFYLFKIMLGAGLIKLKSSDPKWKLGNMSAMDYFYETQPVPNPFTRFFHFNPKPWHRFEVLSNHFVELAAPFLLLLPLRSWRLTGGVIQIMFQLILIASGNLSFLNWLTIVPAICCFDDAFLINNLPPLVQRLALGTPATQSYIQTLISGDFSLVQTPITRTFVSIAFFLLMVKLNISVVRNLLSRKQVMNGSFDKLRLCNTYGAFGTVAEQREELIIESANDIKGPWREYHFKVKPGDVRRRPRWISPYHYRLDWQMWIAAQSGGVERSPWLMSLLLKLLRQEKDVIDLMEGDPWKPASHASGGVDVKEDESPQYIRIEKYIYKFYDPKTDGSSHIRHVKDSNPPYWVRQRVGRYFPRQGIMTAAMLEELLSKR
ncbi:hypothetical protein ACHAW5_001176 [Stephanodiscus triporus]|uniref:Lipase maturation factor n=1 Tax=Stephanodiscus triporus TaxID=2934178 RepID=A0ABD3MW72_9STRA